LGPGGGRAGSRPAAVTGPGKLPWVGDRDQFTTRRRGPLANCGRAVTVAGGIVGVCVGPAASDFSWARDRGRAVLPAHAGGALLKRARSFWTSGMSRLSLGGLRSTLMVQWPSLSR